MIVGGTERIVGFFGFIWVEGESSIEIFIIFSFMGNIDVKNGLYLWSIL